MNLPKLVLVFASLLLAACQSTPPVTPPAVEPPVAETVPEPTPEPAAIPDSIQATRDGFSPLASSPAHELLFELRWGSPDAVAGWAVVFAVPDGPAVRTIRGTQTVPTLTWDGRDDQGALVAQGKYRATLQTAGSDGVYTEKASSMPFVVDIVPPSGSIAVDPLPFPAGASDAQGRPSQVGIRLEIVSGGAPWTVWRLAVLHPDGRRFRDFISEENREDVVVWDGRAVNNALLEPGITYRLEAEVFDLYGNRGVIVGGLPVIAAPVVARSEPEAKPIQVSIRLDGEILAALPVWFAPYAADLEGVTPELKQLNQSSLGQLAELLKSAPGTEVTVVGHANQVLYYDARKAAYEQKETLIPLSIARAEAVRGVLISEGLDPETLGIEGVGASQPLVPFDDAVNRWKNRRVVIELVTSAEE